VLEVLQESRLSTSQLCELDTNFAVIDLQNTDTNVDVVGDGVLEVVSSALRELDLVLGLAHLELDLVVCQVLYEGLFDHVWVVAREEFRVVIVNSLIHVQGLGWFIEFVSNVELSHGGLSHDLFSHISVNHGCLTHVHAHFLLLLLLLGLCLKRFLNVLLSLREASLNLLLWWVLHVHPVVRHDLLQGRSVRWLQLQHAIYQVFELS